MELTEAEVQALLAYATSHELLHLEELVGFERRSGIGREVRSRDLTPLL
jgi:hypothetical protein